MNELFKKIIGSLINENVAFEIATSSENYILLHRNEKDEIVWIAKNLKGCVDVRTCMNGFQTSISFKENSLSEFTNLHDFLLMSQVYDNVVLLDK